MQVLLVFMSYGEEAESLLQGEEFDVTTHHILS